MENTLRCPARIGHLPPVAACVQEKRLRELRSVIVQQTQAKNSAEVVVVRQESEQNSALDCNHEKRLSDRVLRFFDPDLFMSGSKVRRTISPSVQGELSSRLRSRSRGRVGKNTLHGTYDCLPRVQ